METSHDDHNAIDDQQAIEKAIAKVKADSFCEVFTEDGFGIEVYLEVCVTGDELLWHAHRYAPKYWVRVFLTDSPISISRGLRDVELLRVQIPALLAIARESHAEWLMDCLVGNDEKWWPVSRYKERSKP